MADQTKLERASSAGRAPDTSIAIEAQAQIGMLTSIAARGEIDLESLHALSRALATAIDARLAGEARALFHRNCHAEWRAERVAPARPPR
jgi:hypothetical protein